jgi:hypothetical protein
MYNGVPTQEPANVASDAGNSSPRDAEVREDCAPIEREDDVVGLEVAMYHAYRVGSR